MKRQIIPAVMILVTLFLVSGINADMANDQAEVTFVVR
jgi:hypothetical protein